MKTIFIYNRNILLRINNLSNLKKIGEKGQADFRSNL